MPTPAVDYFPVCIAFVLAEEGGLSLDPEDHGNWTGGACGVGTCVGTNYGISAAAYPTLDIASLTQDDAEAIYRRDYWAAVNGASLPPGVAMVALDWGVNSGAGTAARRLQAMLGVVQDGSIGPKTLAAVASHDQAWVVSVYSYTRVSFYRQMGGPYSAALVARAQRCQAAAMALIAGKAMANA